METNSVLLTAPTKVDNLEPMRAQPKLWRRERHWVKNWEMNSVLPTAPVTVESLEPLRAQPKETKREPR